MIKRYDVLVWALKNHGNSNACLLWPFARKENGYGEVRMSDGSIQSVHRVAWLITFGRWPEPCALHHCDVPPCFNPRHLFEGTMGENNADRDRKGRNRVVRGERHGQSVFTEEQIREIRAAYVPWVTTTGMLAKKYGVSPGSILRIVRRESWAHVE